MPSEVEAAEEIKEYPIKGRTAAELRAQLNRQGPLDRDGRHDARTEWYVRWNYPNERRPGACSTGRVKVTLTITYT